MEYSNFGFIFKLRVPLKAPFWGLDVNDLSVRARCWRGGDVGEPGLCSKPAQPSWESLGHPALWAAVLASPSDPSTSPVCVCDQSCEGGCVICVSCCKSAAQLHPSLSAASQQSGSFQQHSGCGALLRELRPAGGQDLS